MIFAILGGTMANIFYFLPDQLLYQCFYQTECPEELSLVNKSFKAMVEEIFYQLNNKILGAYSILKERNFSELKQGYPKHLFMHFINHIIDDAEHLQLERGKYFYGDANPSRLNWEVQYLSTHFQEIHELNQKILRECKRSLAFLKRRCLSTKSKNVNAVCETWACARTNLKGRFTHIKNLDLQRRKLFYLPTQVSDLVNLTKLNCSINFLNSFPTELQSLTQIEQLYLFDNNFRVFPKTICHLSYLIHLDLSQNQLRELPQDFIHLTHLKSLDVSGNQFSEIPKVIFRLTCLQKLWFHCNQITVLPQNITQLTNLESLILAHNQIRQIPEEIGQLTQLTFLNISNNLLTTLPENLLVNRHLRVVWEENESNIIMVNRMELNIS